MKLKSIFMQFETLKNFEFSILIYHLEAKTKSLFVIHKMRKVFVR